MGEFLPEGIESTYPSNCPPLRPKSAMYPDTLLCVRIKITAHGHIRPALQQGTALSRAPGEQIKNHLDNNLHLKGILMSCRLHVTANSHHLGTFGAVASEVTLLVARVAGCFLLRAITSHVTGLVARVASGCLRGCAIARNVTRLVATVAHIATVATEVATLTGLGFIGTIALQMARFSAVVAFLIFAEAFLGEVTLVTTPVTAHVVHVPSSTTTLAVGAVGTVLGDVTRSATSVAST